MTIAPTSGIHHEIRPRESTRSDTIAVTSQPSTSSAAMTTVLVTHDEAEARAMAQRGYRLLEGKLVSLW